MEDEQVQKLKAYCELKKHPFPLQPSSERVQQASEALDMLHKVQSSPVLQVRVRVRVRVRVCVVYLKLVCAQPGGLPSIMPCAYSRSRVPTIEAAQAAVEGDPLERLW